MIEVLIAMAVASYGYINGVVAGIAVGTLTKIVMATIVGV